MMRNQLILFCVLCASQFGAGPAWAHAAEQGFVLLLPTNAYITAGTMAVAATMVLLVLLKPGQLEHVFKPFVASWRVPTQQMEVFSSVLAAIGFAALIYIGLRGPSDPQSNLLPLFLWTVWWMAMYIVQAVLFDIWRWINPWFGLHKLLFPKVAPPLKMPLALSIWPAVLLFVIFQWFVLADVAPNDPRRLATICAGYWALTLIGMTLFGRDTWLRQVECFTVMFALIGRLRPFFQGRTATIGFPGWQCFQSREFGLAHAMFTLIILASGSFDGLYETFWWLDKMGINPLEFPGRSAVVTSTTIGLLFAIVLLTCIFAVAVWVGMSAAGQLGWACKKGFPDLFVRFSVTLLPIAIGYHFAHYFVTFLVQIQYFLANLADPLAAGWALLGLDAIRIKTGFLATPETVKIIWQTQAGVVVFSHILSVLMGHRTAELLSDDRRVVVRLQLGLSVLMVAYTVFGLWLLASPRGA